MSSPPPQHSLSSPTSGNTPHPVLPTPSSSTSVSIRQNNKTSQLRQRQELEQQLVEKQKQLQETSSGIGKNVLARQVSQLQDRIKEIDSVINNPTSNDEIQPVSVDRLRSLERDLSSYRSHPLSPGISSIRNKEKLLNQRTTSGLDPLPSPSTSTLLPPTHGHDSTSLLPLPPPPTGSTPTKRRSKIPNTDRRNTDIEFATEIGQGLLLEVRKMQALLQEKEEKLRTLENQKADLERAAEAMAKQMRQREENEEKLKEETWNLELAKQELTISVTELQQNLSKANVEQNKLDKQVNVLRSEIEKLRDKEEKLTNTIDTMKQRHEQDMSSIRRHAAAIQREKSDQSKQIEALTSELAIAKAQSRIGKHVSTDTEVNPRSGDTTDDQTTNTLAVNNETSPTSSPPSSPKLAPARNQAMEVETLKTSLAHAHRMVSNLRSNLHKEKTEKFEFKKLLADSQETIEQLQNDPRMWVDAGPTRGASGSSSNIVTREDGLGPARRPHKASLSSSTKRRGSRKPTSGRIKPKGSSPNATADGDSIYSYSSMSELDDSEEVDSFDDSDAGFDNTVSKKKTVGFTPLSSELSRSQSQNQLQKPVMVDAEVNTDPMDDSMLPLNTLGDSTADPVTRSLGDELGMAMSQKSPEESKPATSSMKDAAVGLIAGVGAAVGVDALMKPTGIEIYTQTDVYEEPKAIPGIEMITQTDPEPEAQVNEVFTQTDSSKLEQLSLATMSVEPTKPVELELVSQTPIGVEPEDPSIALAAAAAATAAAIAAYRSKALEDSVDCSVQSDPIDPSIALAETAAAIAAARSKALEEAVDCSVQSDPVDPSIALAETAAAIAAARSKALEQAVDCSVQSDPVDPSIALAETAAAIAAARSKALEEAVDCSIQSDPIDPSIALAETAAAIAASRSKALEEAVDCSVQSDPIDPSIALDATAAAIAESRAKALEEAVDCSVQSDPIDPSIALAETSAAVAASRFAALEAAVDTATQSEEPVEDPSISLAALAASAAASAAAIAGAISESRSKALEAAIDCSTQSDEPEPVDPAIALAEKEAIIAAARAKSFEAAVHCSTQSEEPEPVDPSIALAATAAAIAENRAKALEAAVDCSTQSDEPEKEDPSIALAAAAAAAIASSRSKALESAIDCSTQSDEPEKEDPSIAIAAAKAASLATAAAIAAGIAASRSSALESAIDTSTQSDEPEVEDPSIALAKTVAAAAALRTAALEAAVHSSTQSDPEDPSIAAAAIAEAIASSRSASLESAISTSTQFEEEDPSIAAAAAEAAAVSTALATATAIAASRLASLEAAVDSCTQSEGPSVIDQETQFEETRVVDIGVQSTPAVAVDAFIQSEFVETKDSVVQYESSAKDVSVQHQHTTDAIDHETQYDVLGVDHSTQSELNETVECGVQSDSPVTADASAQHDFVNAIDANVQYEVESTDIGVQCEEENTASGIGAILPIPPIASHTFSDSEDEFFDANSKPSSRRTIDSAVFNNLKPESRNSNLSESHLIPVLLPHTQNELGSDRSDDNQKTVSDGQEGSSSLKKNAMIAAAATAAAASVLKHNKSVSDHEEDSDALRSIPSDVNTLAIGEDSLGNKIAPHQLNNVSERSRQGQDIQELGNVAPAEKMYSKAETDSLIATAVALALKNAESLKSSQNNQDDVLDNTKHHAHGLNSKNEDPAIVTPTSDISRTSRNDDDDEQPGDENFGNVLVHSPREEDTITFLPYDEAAQRHRDRFVLPNIDSSHVDFFENLKHQETEPKKERPELTIGPSIVFAQEPEEPEEREITAADVPQRPANPPPHELLNKAGLSSTFTDSRSMSPSSLHSKGKGPLEYSDLESNSARSNDDLQRTAILQQQRLDAKRGSVDASSVSTSNTNEQLRSLNSSQYDAVTRSTGATDPTMINLITQTMIGDWLYKYTRKAVGGGFSEKSHKRYFWIHPYTRTLYWSVSAPGLNGNESKAKSALIENITSVPNYSYATDGTPNVSLLIQTSHRQIKVTAPNMEKHDLWFEAITHLLSRDRSGKGLTLLNDTKKAENPNNRSVSSGTTGSLLNRPSFRRLHDVFQQPSSAQSMSTTDDHVDLEYDDDDEALEDVRMCCNGKHHVSKLEKDHTHRQPYRKRKSRATITS